MKLSHEKLQSQIADVQNSAEIMSNELPAAIKQLREEMARNMETEENQPPPESNSVEWPEKKHCEQNKILCSAPHQLG